MIMMRELYCHLTGPQFLDGVLDQIKTINLLVNYHLLSQILKVLMTFMILDLTLI